MNYFVRHEQNCATSTFICVTVLINSAFHKQPFQTISENIPETSQTSKMKLIAKKVNCYQPFAFSAKSFILAFIDVQF